MGPFKRNREGLPISRSYYIAAQSAEFTPCTMLPGTESGK